MSNSFIMGGDEAGVTMHDVADLPIDQQAEYDQQAAELDHAIQVFMSLSTRMIIFHALKMKDDFDETAAEFGQAMASIPRALALSVLGTLVGREASRYVGKLGGPEKIWEMFTNDEMPRCTCDNPDCENRLMPPDPDDNGD